MPDDRQPQAGPFGPRRSPRFVVRDNDDDRATEKIERFLSGPVPQSAQPIAARLERRRSAEAAFDTRTDFAAALRRETARAERYGRPATVVAIEFAALPGATADRDFSTTDRLARPIGFTLRREARDTDRIVRVALNRFHVLLPETSEADAFHYIDRARYACEMWFAGAELPIRLRIETASAGPDQSLSEALAAIEDRLSA